MIVEVVTNQTMRDSDAWTIKNLTPSKELMYRAGKGIYEAASWKEPVAIVCGKGNNAGDGFVVADLLHTAGISCTLILLSEEFSEDGKYYFDIAEKHGVPVKNFAPGMDLSGYASILDCIFGTGFRGEVCGIYRDVIEAVNQSHSYVVSADINSGLNGDTGLGDLYIKSDLTVSIGTFKLGHFKGNSSQAMKKKVNIDIGIQIIGPTISLEVDSI